MSSKCLHIDKSEYLDDTKHGNSLSVSFITRLKSVLVKVKVGGSKGNLILKLN